MSIPWRQASSTEGDSQRGIPTFALAHNKIQGGQSLQSFCLVSLKAERVASCKLEYLLNISLSLVAT